MSIDPSRQLVLLWSKSRGRYEDRTLDIVSMEQVGGKYSVRFRKGRFPFSYNPESVIVAEADQAWEVDEDSLVEVNGVPWTAVTRLESFSTEAGAWTRVHYSTSAGGGFRSFPHQQVRVVSNARAAPRVDQLVRYFSSVVAALPEDDPLRFPYSRMSFIHPDSALASYLDGGPIERAAHSADLIFPFSSNLSQRDALDSALSHKISVIEGPPGTGKTQTILNLIANIVRDPNATVGVVSFNNAAVDNVYEKLSKQGIGFIAAPLGSKAKRSEFLDGQGARNAELAEFLESRPVYGMDDRQIGLIASSVHRVYQLERELAQARGLLTQLELEQQQFDELFPATEISAGLPGHVERWASTRFLELLAAVQLLEFRTSRWHRLGWAVRRRWVYRLPPQVDERDPAFAVEVQRAYFRRRIGEVKQQIQSAETQLRTPELAAVSENMQRLSMAVLRDTVRQRYQGKDAAIYTAESLWRQRDQFALDYPVMLSTCHSLPSNVGPGRLLDYLIIDEASQVNLAVAVLAMSTARRVIVVGDVRQLPHIAEDVGGLGAPSGLEAYDYSRHSILSSLMAVYGESLPRTMLREHYRCDPRIIDFCNRKFYRGQLIPMREPGQGAALALVHTAPGQHSRSHSDGGHTNQRELEVLVNEALPAFCAGVSLSDIGVITPFRRQADLIAQVLPGVEADTVHKFQGREKSTIVMSTLIDASHSDTRLATFVDDPCLVNVAVSRAQDRLVLVSNPALPPECQHLRDLTAYIQQRSPGGFLRSQVVSVFDTLYTEYAEVLRGLSNRIRGVAPYRSEEAVLVVLDDLLARDEFHHLRYNYQVLLYNLVTDTSRLTEAEAAFVRNRSSADFVISNRTTDQVLGVIEVDGFTYHEDNPEQRRRDALKDSILAKHRIGVLRLPTTGSGEEERLVQFLRGLTQPTAQLTT